MWATVALLLAAGCAGATGEVVDRGDVGVQTYQPE